MHHWRALVALALVGLMPLGVWAQVQSYIATFDGAPTTILPYAPAGWGLQVHSREATTWDQLVPMAADHGDTCTAPPATHAWDGSYGGAVYQCANHMMTALNPEGYGVIYLTPPVMADWTDGEAVIRWDMSTKRFTLRDWVDVWVQPYDEQLALPLQSPHVDLAGPPARYMQFMMDQGGGGTDAVFRASGANGFANPWQDLGGDWGGYNSFLVPDLARRDTFEIHISRTHVKIGMPAYNHWWHDFEIPGGPIDWTQGVVMFGHHAYPTPDKGCLDGGSTCSFGSWHFDNVSVSPAVPITIDRATPRQIRNGSVNDVWTFPPAPAGASLRFAAVNSNGGLNGPGLPVIDLSWNDGASWQTHTPQPSVDRDTTDTFHARSYFVPVPEGATAVRVRGQGHGWGSGEWQAADAAVFSQGNRPRTPTPLPPNPTATATPVPTPTPGPTSTATPEPPPTATLTLPPTPAPPVGATPTLTAHCWKFEQFGSAMQSRPLTDDQCDQ